MKGSLPNFALSPHLVFSEADHMLKITGEKSHGVNALLVMHFMSENLEFVMAFTPGLVWKYILPRAPQHDFQRVRFYFKKNIYSEMMTNTHGWLGRLLIAR